MRACRVTLLVAPRARTQPVTCHIFERSVEMPKHSSQREYFKPLQMLLAVKEKNGGKLNSHLWFFSGFCRQMQPAYTFVRGRAAAALVARTRAHTHPFPRSVAAAVG